MHLFSCIVESCSANGSNGLGRFSISIPRTSASSGAGSRKPTGIIDVALIQSLVGRAKWLIWSRTMVILSSTNAIISQRRAFELVARRAKARFVLGLSATVARKDGHHPIIFMQCGPVRHRVDARAQTVGRGISPPRETSADRISVAANLWRPLSVLHAMRSTRPSRRTKSRNNLIFDDVLKALEAKRRPLC